jgi:hypothetical protein
MPRKHGLIRERRARRKSAVLVWSACDGLAGSAQVSNRRYAQENVMPAHITDQTATLELPRRDYLGWVRRFGPRGVPYEVIAILSSKEVSIRVLTTGEEVDYDVADLLNDPED